VSFVGAILYCFTKLSEDSNKSEQELIENDITVNYYKSTYNEGEKSDEYIMSPNKMSIN